ncbi:hypothetical protein, partial [Oceaniglobus trochenteri]|uniref:hypothetical protein n=1 Tax=Oceaniglobus trochenteri TaxID=2763260 RepID=UPI001CFFED96
IVIPSGSGSRDFCVQFDIRSGSADAAAGSFSALAFGDGSVVASNAGLTETLASASARGASMDLIDWKVQATQSAAAGTLQVRAFDCDVKF